MRREACLPDARRTAGGPLALRLSYLDPATEGDLPAAAEALAQATRAYPDALPG